jgi:hypothetical protein
MTWECKIIKADNGFIIEYQEEIDDSKFETKHIVIEDEMDDEKKNMADMLYKVADYFGVNYNKFALDNLKITWDEKGHKVD